MKMAKTVGGSGVVLMIRLLILLVLVSSVAEAHSEYSCDVLRILDGDTIECRVLIDPYFKLYKDEKIRFARINCPEVTGSDKPLGLKAKSEVESKLALKKALLKSLVDDKYGRVVAEVYVGGSNLNDYLLTSGLCSPYNR